MSLPEGCALSAYYLSQEQPSVHYMSVSESCGFQLWLWGHVWERSEAWCNMKLQCRFPSFSWHACLQGQTINPQPITLNTATLCRSCFLFLRLINFADVKIDLEDGLSACISISVNFMWITLVIEGNSFYSAIHVSFITDGFTKTALRIGPLSHSKF